MKPLSDRVALVAGATRGAGRGIARGLGEAGATVYCTGRSVRGAPSPYGRPETIEETAEMITAAGGAAIATRVDHTVESEVASLVERILGEHGRLDVLVNSIAGEDPLLGGWHASWETDLEHADAAIRQALLSHVITAKHVVPSMIERKRGLVVEVTEGDLPGWGGGNAVSSLIKSAHKDLACRMGAELREHEVTVVAITPGFLRSETMLEHFGVTEENWRDGAAKDEHFLQSETPLFIGRAVAALAADENALERTGDTTSSWELARAYGFTDADGSRPDWGTYFQSILPTLGFGFPEGLRHQITWLERTLNRARRYAGQPPCPATS